MVEGREALGEGVHVQYPGGAGDPERHIAPGRVTLPAGPARVYGGEGAIGHGSALEFQRQDGAVVDPFGPEEGSDLGVDVLRLGIEHPAQRIGDVDGVVHDRPATRQLGVQKPAARDLAVVRPVDREDASDPPRAHDLSSLPNGR